jgi:hypothetical protein
MSSDHLTRREPTDSQILRERQVALDVVQAFAIGDRATFEARAREIEPRRLILALAYIGAMLLGDVGEHGPDTPPSQTVSMIMDLRTRACAGLTVD